MHEGVFDVMADAIVNPKCDECGIPVRPADPLAGPHLCRACAEKVRIGMALAYREFIGNERPSRKVHVVRLPPGMQREREIALRAHCVDDADAEGKAR